MSGFDIHVWSCVCNTFARVCDGFVISLCVSVCVCVYSLSLSLSGVSACERRCLLSECVSICEGSLEGVFVCRRAQSDVHVWMC